MDFHTTVLMALALTLGPVAYLISPLVVSYCRKKGMVAQVTERSSHTKPTPHGGGILLPLLVVPMGLLMTFYWPLPFKGYLFTLLLSSVVVAYVSWLDDRHELSPKVRLIIHMAAVTTTLFLLPPLFDFMPLWLEKLIILFGWAWFVNLYNFMDGSDGLATTEAIALGLGLAMVVPAFAPLGLLLAAVGTGFLRVNGAPARIFMGDVGATWLGFMIAGLFLLAAVDDTLNVIWPLATLPLVFALDATSTLTRRVLQGHKPWEPHKTFWFHRYLALGNSHKQLVGRVALLNLLLLGLGLVSYRLGHGAYGFFCGVLVLCAVACYIRSRELRGPYHHDIKQRRTRQRS
jgi:UDP-N-acetylmuramyl pentapeptide phosphotransferase/UDP-N-acetylglucosamine-1-phosphate transferase